MNVICVNIIFTNSLCIPVFELLWHFEIESVYQSFKVNFCSFYSVSALLATALLAMQTAVIARGILSICHIPVFCPDEVQFSASCRKIILVSGEVKFIQMFTGDQPQRRCESARDSLTNNQP